VAPEPAPEAPPPVPVFSSRAALEDHARASGLATRWHRAGFALAHGDDWHVHYEALDHLRADVSDATVIVYAPPARTLAEARPALQTQLTSLLMPVTRLDYADEVGQYAGSRWQDFSGEACLDDLCRPLAGRLYDAGGQVVAVAAFGRDSLPDDWSLIAPAEALAANTWRHPAGLEFALPASRLVEHHSHEGDEFDHWTLRATECCGAPIFVGPVSGAVDLDAPDGLADALSEWLPDLAIEQVEPLSGGASGRRLAGRSRDQLGREAYARAAVVNHGGTWFAVAASVPTIAPPGELEDRFADFETLVAGLR